SRGLLRKRGVMLKVYVKCLPFILANVFCLVVASLSIQEARAQFFEKEYYKLLEITQNSLRKEKEKKKNWNLDLKYKLQPSVTFVGHSWSVRFQPTTIDFARKTKVEVNHSSMGSNTAQI